MRRTDAILLATFALCVAAATLCLLPGDGPALPPVDDAPPTPVAAPPADAPADTATAPLAAIGAAEASAHPRVDTTGWTSGVVRGDIELAVSVLDRIESIVVEVVEARSAVRGDGSVKLPTRLLAKVEQGRGTPTFEVTGIPFSEHPYFVLVRSPGLNGSRAVVTIDKEQPLHDGLVLAITPGVAFALLVRDQDMTPYAGLDVSLQPIGEPHGRPPRNGRTDNFGSLVLPDMLAGEYEMRTTLDGALVVDPERVVVQPGGRAPMSGQPHKLVIERGVPVQVTVSSRFGQPVAAVKVTATATDRLKLTVREAMSDLVGNAQLPLLQGGTWQISIAHEGYHFWDRQITVKPFQDPVRIDAQLVPLAR